MPRMTVDEMMALVPVQAVGSERDVDGTLILLRPKFRHPRMAWLQRRLSRPHFRVKLDARGACLWEAMDGVRTVRQVCEALRERFGAEAEPVEERALAFIHHLATGKFIRLQNR
jgi:hypothetical protein